MWRNARPAGVVVSIGELMARNPIPRSLSASMRVMSAPGEAPQSVEIEDDEDVTVAQVVEARGEVRAIGLRPGGVIFEHTFAAGGVERVALAVEDLSAFGGGDAGVPDEIHGVDGLEKPSVDVFYRAEIISGLSGGKGVRSGGAAWFGGGSPETGDFRGRADGSTPIP